MKSIILLFFSVFVAISYGQNPNTVVAYGKFNVEYGNLDNARIILYEDGKKVEVYTPSRIGKFEFVLDLGYQYQFKFEKAGYVSKLVDFDTRVSKSILDAPEFEPFPDFDFHVTLFEVYPNVDTMFFTKPVGKIAYNAELNDFDWNKDYDLEVKRSIEEIEKEIRIKRQEKLDKETTKPDEPQVTEKSEQNPAKDEVQITEQETPNQQTTKVKEVTSVNKEPSEKAVSMPSKTSNTVDETESNQVPQSTNKTTAPNQSPTQQKKETPSSQSETKEVVQTETKPIQPSKKEVQKTEQIELMGKTVIQTPVETPKGTAIFVKVSYSWGGPFYFILEENNKYLNISESYYNIMVNKKKN